MKKQSISEAAMKERRRTHLERGAKRPALKARLLKRKNRAVLTKASELTVPLPRSCSMSYDTAL